MFRQPNPLILMYHDVRDFEDTSFPSRYAGTSFLTRLEFRQQLDFLEEHFTVVSLRELQQRKMMGSMAANLAVLTFDDGLADHFGSVRPELLSRGLPASFFIPTAPVFDHAIIPSHKIQFLLACEVGERTVVREIKRELDEARSDDPTIASFEVLWAEFSVSLWSNNSWSAEQVFVTRLLRSGLEPAVIREQILDNLFARLVCTDHVGFAKEFYLSAEQVSTLHRDGFEIGSHGHTSDPLTNFVGGALHDDLDHSASMLKEFAVPPEFAISYPNGAVDASVVEAARKCGYTIGLTTESAPVTLEHDMLLLPRLNAPAALPPKVKI
jgi:peptidoglycan/xylan/chitin deacetylase (PgdA/CDA1 family)